MQGFQVSLTTQKPKRSKKAKDWQSFTLANSFLSCKRREFRWLKSHLFFETLIPICLSDGTNMRPIIITDHAIVRYLERVYGLDLESLKQEITAKIKPAIEIGAASVRIGDHTYCIVINDRSASLTTVIDGRQSPTAKAKKFGGKVA